MFTENLTSIEKFPKNRKIRETLKYQTILILRKITRTHAGFQEKIFNARW